MQFNSRRILRTVLVNAALTLFVSFLHAQVPATPNAKYRLDNNTATDYGASSYNGSLSGTSASVSRIGEANKALSFAGSSSTGTLPSGLVTALQNDFTVGFWFKTNMIANTGAQWYNGNSLVDGEVGGVTNDWGICLIDAGKVCFGVGNPDITIKSPLTYNNNAWHFVTATRNKAGGTIILYVDGLQVASSTGINTGILNAPSVIGLGRSSAISSGSYTGAMDDVVTYNRVLSGAEVTSLYTAYLLVALPVKWLSFTGSATDKQIMLRWQVEQTTELDYFQPEYSLDGNQFSALPITPADRSYVTGQTASYAAQLEKPLGNGWLFRIKQVDKDGNFSYSKTIRVTNTSGVHNVSLAANPVGSTLVVVNKSNNKINRIKITNESGQVVISRIIDNNEKINSVSVAQLTPGYYVMTVDGSDNSRIPFIKK